MAAVFAEWNRGELDSYLIEVTRDILGFRDAQGEAVVDFIVDAAGQKGTGKWTVNAALDAAHAHRRSNWARRLKRVFGIEIEQCVRCGGKLKVIASIEEPQLIERTLAHRRERGEEAAPTASLGARAPPQESLF